MAHVTLNSEGGLLHRIAAAVEAVGQSLSTAFVVNSSAEARFREVQKLQSLSDAELAKRGIPRDRIAHYVLRDIHAI